jgi:demethylmenaquinone methyltransferase/2-methoxy-6-polyprenyl-1,4-benzoquinol methylase
LSELRGAERARYVEAMFARIVRRYDLMDTLMTFGQDRRWRELTVDATLMRPGGLALDVAAGTGELTLALVGRGEARLAVGVDFTPEMLEAAKAKAEQAGLTGRRGAPPLRTQIARSASTAPPSPRGKGAGGLGRRGRVAFVGGDALALPFPDDTFDAATIGFGLRNMGDLPRALAEMRRVVRPGGRVVSLELTHTPFPLIRLLFWPYFRLLVPLIGRLVSGDPEAYGYLPDSLARFPAASELAGLMQAAGLRQIRYRYVGLGTVAIHVGVKPEGR